MKTLPLFFLLFIFWFMSWVSGCGPSLATPTPISTSTPLPALQPTCIPTPGDFYSNNGSTNKQATDLADKIYGQLFMGALGNHDLVGMKDAQNQALQFLTYEVKRWTAVSDEISFEDDGKARIFVTFISPQLARAAALTHAIMIRDIEGHNLNAYTAKSLQRLDKRNEYLFLVTVQIEANRVSQETLTLPSEFFALKGTSGTPIQHIRHDHFLDNPIPLSRGNIAGFVYFPLTQLNGEKCPRVLDEERDSYLIFWMGNVQTKKQTQNIPFEIPFIAPALFDNEFIPTPLPNTPFNPDEFTPSKELPPFITFSTTPNEFWRGLTRFVWNKLTFDGLVLE